MSQIKMAYLLVAHKCPEQVNLFVQQLLDYGECDIYIHIDKKKPEMIEKIVKSNRVFVCSVYDVRWGSFEIVKAGYHLMRMARASGKDYTHMYFGSGQDLLVRKGLYEYLSDHLETTFMHIENEVTSTNRASARYRIRWPSRLMVRNDLHLYRFIRIGMQLLCKFGVVLFPNKNRLEKPIKFYEGRTWFIAPIKVMEYILDFIDDNSDYEKFWEDSLASDLMFFQTIIMNSPYGDKVEDELMYVEFGKSFRTNNHPLTITPDVLDKIRDGNWYCARKFELYESNLSEQAIKQCLEDTVG